jgi:hypothetical protein
LQTFIYACEGNGDVLTEFSFLCFLMLLSILCVLHILNIFCQ